MPINSPFKLLDAYGKKDKDIFFGRAEEVEALYEMAYQTNLMLVYGPSGSGKTSLVQCGLANRFRASDWFDLYIRRGENINDSLRRTLSAYGQIAAVPSGTLIERLAPIKGQLPDGLPFSGAQLPASETIQSLRRIYDYYLKPIYLIFDQLEELYILGSDQEQQTFYQTIHQILDNEEYCRIIIVLREEYLAELDEFEKVVPYLFEKRLRVEPMARQKTREVILGTTQKFGIQLEKKEETSALIIDALAKGQKRVELTYLQVFLDKLFRKASRGSLEEVVFDNQLVRGLGHIENVLGEFLDEQASLIQGRLLREFSDAPPDAVSRVLNAFATLEGTKQPLRREEVAASGLGEGPTAFCLDELEKARLLRLEGGFYELAHDALAHQVAQERTAEEVAILQATKIVKDRFSAYEATRSLLNKNELNLLEGYRKQLREEGRFSSEEWDFIHKSTWEFKRWRLFRYAILLLAMAILAAFSIYSQWLKNRAQESERQAVELLDTVRQQQVVMAQSRAEAYLAKARESISKEHYTDALREAETALAFDSIRQELQPKGASIRMQAAQLMADAQKRLDSKGQFDLLIAEGDSLYELGEAHYVDALQKYEAAFELGYGESLANDKTVVVKKELGSAFERLKTRARAFYEAGGYTYALRAYEEAARIEPGDSSIQAMIQECRQKMEGHD